MKKEIRVVKDNIIQITTVDERFYIKAVDILDKEGNKIGGEFVTVPSISWIASFYPKGIAFWKFLANHGWDESVKIKEEAGNKGSKVHLAIADLIASKEINMGSKYPNKEGVEEELSAEEYYCVMTFVDWFKEVNPVVHANEEILFSIELDCAGTLDLYCTIRRLVKKATKKEEKEGIGDIYAFELWIIDFKTGASVWPEHHVQLSGYKKLKLEQLLNMALKQAEENPEKPFPVPEIKLGILQLGYKKNRRGFKFTEIPDNFEMFEATQKIWANETAGISPKQIDYPVKLTLKEEAKDEQANIR